MNRTKIDELIELGWTKKDFLELMNEIGEYAFSEDTIGTRKNDASSVFEMLQKLGLPIGSRGTKYIKDILLYCRQDDNPDKLLKKDAYLVLQKRYNTKYEGIRGCVKSAIDKAFLNPTPEAKKMYKAEINKRGYPTVREFINIVYANLWFI